MQSVSNALNRLHEETAWFARAHEVRLLVVRTSGDLRKVVLKLLPMFEFHADNFSPWILLEDARTAGNDGWELRANRLIADWERRREAFSKEGVHLPRLEIAGATGSSAGPQAAPGGGLDVFKNAAALILQALRAPLRGLVLILAPPVADDPGALETEIEILLGSPELTGCRLALVIDEDLPPPHRLLKALGQHALSCDCVVDPKELETDLGAMLQGGDGSHTARSDGAWPKGVAPPRRVDDPPEIPRAQRDAALLEAGINPAFLDEGPRLRNLVMGAALAMKQGRGAEAVRQQREACDLCGVLEMHELKVICQVALASYLSGLGRGGEAVRELEQAAGYAAEHCLPKAQSQAHLALGLLHALAGQLTLARREYARAAQAAEAANVEILAIEGWRLAAQIALQAGDEQDATSCFQRAILTAATSDPGVMKMSTAPEAARRLAGLYEKRGLRQHAESLYEQADQMERGEFRVVTVSDTPPSGAPVDGSPDP